MNFIQKHGVLISLICLICVFSLFNPVFIKLGSITNILGQMTINGFIALGMTFVIVSGGIDLSVGSMLALVGFGLGYLINHGFNEILAMMIVISLGISLGFFNGFFIAKLNLQPFIMTLASMTMYRGLTYIISRALPESNLNKKAPIFDFLSQGEVLNLPFPTILFLVFFYYFFYITAQNDNWKKYFCCWRE